MGLTKLLLSTRVLCDTVLHPNPQCTQLWYSAVQCILTSRKKWTVLKGVCLHAVDISASQVVLEVRSREGKVQGESVEGQRRTADRQIQRVKEKVSLKSWTPSDGYRAQRASNRRINVHPFSKER